MDEARTVLERLERIEALDRAGAPATVLLEELRALVRDGEVWVEVEGGRASRAALALARCREALDGAREEVPLAAAP